MPGRCSRLLVRLALVALLAAPAPSFAAASWPQLGFDAGHSGFNSAEDTLSRQNVARLQQQWSVAVSASNAPGSLLEDSDTVFASSTNGTIYALDADNGATLWTYPSGSGYPTSGSSISVDGGSLYTVCAIAASTQGICALNEANGKLEWARAPVGSSTYAGSPSVADGNVYFDACHASCDAIDAVNEANGKPVWSRTVPCIGTSPLAPAVYQGLVYANVLSGCNQAGVVALNDKNGNTRWATSFGVGTVVGLSVAQDIVCAVVQNGNVESVYFLSASDGTIEHAASGSSESTAPSFPAIAYGDGYVPISASLNAYALHVKRYAPKFVFQVAGMAPAATVANGVLYTLLNGNPAALDARNGDVLWSSQQIAPGGAFPIVVNATVYGGCQGYSICAWSLPNRHGHRLLRRR
jgi:outer membrane protein assembly factor BamB